MTDATDNIEEAIGAFLKASGSPKLHMFLHFEQEEMRKVMNTIMADAYSLGFDVAMKTNTLADTARLDWLADPANEAVGRIVLNNAVPSERGDLRAAIDAAMAD